MPKTMDWRKARKFAATEVKYDNGTVLENGPQAGRVIYKPVRDSLEARAREAERQWLKQVGKQGKKP